MSKFRKKPVVIEAEMKDTPTYSLRNWQKYQHYKDRRPLWIKLYNDILDDYDFQCLPDDSKYHFIASMLLASRYDNRIPADPVWLAKAMHLSQKSVDLTPLKSCGLITYSESASELLASCLQPASPEKRREERETEKKVPRSRSESDPPGFSEFWTAYPRKVGKGAARRAWAKLNGRSEEVLPAALSALAWQRMSPEWTREGGQFIPHPATYLNQERWQDEPGATGDPGIPESTRKRLSGIAAWVARKEAERDTR